MSAITTTKTISRMRSRLPHLARATRMSRGEVTIWVLSAVLVAAGVALLSSGAVTASPVVGSMQVSIWILLVAFAAAERFVVHVHFRRSAHSMSLGEIPLVFALVFASGHDVILAGAIGRLLVLAVHRRLPPIRLAFNFGQFLLGNCIAVIVFHAVAGGQTQIDPVVWAAAALATVATSVAAVLLISAAVSLSDGRLSVTQIASVAAHRPGRRRGQHQHRPLRRDRRLQRLARRDPDGRAGHRHVPHLPGLRRRAPAPPGAWSSSTRPRGHCRAARRSGPRSRGSLGQALEAFRAEVAEIIFFSPDGKDALRTTVRASGAGTMLEGLEPAIVAELRSLICDPELGALATREIADGPLAAYLEQRGWAGACSRCSPRAQLHGRDDDRQPVGSRRPLHRR